MMRRLFASALLLLTCATQVHAQDLRKQSDATYPLFFVMIDSSDHIASKTGLSPSVVISKNGGSFAAPSGAVSEVGHGLYKVAGNTTDSNTLGELHLYVTATGADPVNKSYTIVGYDPFSPYPTNFTALAIDSAGRVKTQVKFVKNVGLTYPFTMTDSTTHAPLTGLTNASFTKKIVCDSGSATSLSGTITEIDATNMPGWYRITFTNSEMNCDAWAIRFAAAGADDTDLTGTPNN